MVTPRKTLSSPEGPDSEAWCDLLLPGKMQVARDSV